MNFRDYVVNSFQKIPEGTTFYGGVNALSNDPGGFFVLILNIFVGAFFIFCLIMAVRSAQIFAIISYERFRRSEKPNHKSVDLRFVIGIFMASSAILMMCSGIKHKEHDTVISFNGSEIYLRNSPLLAQSLFFNDTFNIKDLKTVDIVPEKAHIKGNQTVNMCVLKFNEVDRTENSFWLRDEDMRHLNLNSCHSY